MDLFSQIHAFISVIWFYNFRFDAIILYEYYFGITEH